MHLSIHPNNWSYWERKSFSREADLAIIGCGIVGLNAGIRFLENSPKAKVIILERGLSPDGASTKNAGFACFGSPGELLDDLKNAPLEEVFALFKRRYDGIFALRKRLDAEDFGWTPSGGFEIFNEANLQDFPSINQLEEINREIYKCIGIHDYFQIADEEISEHGLINLPHLIKTQHESLLNPVKMIQALIKKFYSLGGNIFFGMDVTQWIEDELNVKILCKNSAQFLAKKLLIAVNGFAKQLIPDIALNAARNMVICIRPSNALLLKGAYHYHHGYVYFRPVEDGVLIGGGRHQDLENEYTDEIQINQKIYRYLVQFAEQHILGNQKYEIIDQWVGIMGLGPVKKPIILMQTPRVGVSVRMGGMGVAIGTLVGNDAAEMLL